MATRHRSTASNAGLPAPVDDDAAATLTVISGADPPRAKIDDRDAASRALIDAALDGNRESLEKLLGIVHPIIVRYCRSRVSASGRSLSGADDIAQEVCLAVVAALPSYRKGTTPLLAWVYGIAAHKVADAHRLSARIQSVSVPEIPDGIAEDVTPEQQAVRTDTADRMASLLRTLPTQQQEVLRLRVIVGWSAEQTADALSMTAGAVRVAQHRALHKLRSMLTASGEAGPDAGGWAEVIG